MPKISLLRSYKFLRVFFMIMALADVNNGGTYMGISPGRVRPCTHRPERERAHHRISFGCTGRMSLKKYVFGCEGKITLFSFPKNPALRKQLSLFFQGSNGVSQVCLLMKVL